MKKCFAILGLLVILVPLVLGGIFQTPDALAQEPDARHKISGLLQLHVDAKERAIKGVPLEEGEVDILQGKGVRTKELDKERTFIYFTQKPSQSQTAELRSMGLTLYPDSWIPPVKKHPYGFMLADMPVDRLTAVAGKSYVVRLDTAERLLEPKNDLADATTKANLVWPSYNGTGINIAVLDSGLDVNASPPIVSHHPDIPNPVASKDYSLWPLLGDDIRNTYTGHGTHVTGTALGRGTQSADVYKGSAPGASLIFLKIDSGGGASAAAIINAMNAARNTYGADVITMSYGGWGDYHDGSEAMEQAVDSAVYDGAVVFISAGNEASNAEHYSGTVAANSTTGDITVSVTGAGVNNTVLAFNMVWYDGLDTNNNLELKYYNVSHTLQPSTNQNQTESLRGTESEYSRRDGYVGAGTSTYYLQVTNHSLTNSQFFHLYYNPGYNLTGAGSVTFASPDQGYTISSPADADSAIAVGSYNTRQIWYDYANNGWWFPSDPVGQISTFSSRGPRVDTGAPPKPNIVAPGLGIISTRDNDVYPWPGGANSRYIDNNGPNVNDPVKNDGNGLAEYYLMQGTSMASPHAAGIAALILQKYPGWTPAQVKNAIERTATNKGDPGWDAIYGWGLIDAQAAVGSSLPTAASYSNAGHTIPCNNFVSYTDEHTVYMYMTNLVPSSLYRVAYYDGTNDKVYTDEVTSDASGNLSSQRTFRETPPADQPGTWHVIVSERAQTPPATYSSTWEYNLTSDTFQVQQSAIPEFPTALAAIVALALSAGIYLWMRREAAPIPA